MLRTARRWLAVWVLLVPTAGAAAQAPRIDELQLERLVFLAVLEGAFVDGLGDDELTVLLRRDDGADFHDFIYACPICMPTVHALQVYQARPALYGRKSGNTFGRGLPRELRRQLHSADPEVRLAAVSALVDRWIGRRLRVMRLTGAELQRWHDAIAAGHERGAELLATYRRNGKVGRKAPAYAEVDSECAICAGATRAVQACRADPTVDADAAVSPDPLAAALLVQAERHLVATEARFRNGIAALHDLAHAFASYEKAGLAAAASDDDRLAVRRRLFEVARRVEGIAAQRVENGTVAPLYLAGYRALRLEAELALKQAERELGLP